MPKYEQFALTAQNLGCRVSFDEPMCKHTNFRVGGKVPLFVEVHSEEVLSALIKQANKDSIKLRVIGNGSNVIVPDKGIDCVVLHMCGELCDISLVGENEIVSSAGAKLSKLCELALEHSLSGLEFAWGIPASVGGATYMNAGAYGGEMKDVIVSCSYLDSKGKRHELKADDMDLSYRHSSFSGTGDIITGVTMRFKKADRGDIKAKMDDYLSKRKLKQPLEYPSAGSTFKRPKGCFAGALIQECGLKGKRIGGAMVSEKHAGFIINEGNATAADITELIHYVQDTVYREKGIQLECEVRIWENK